MKQATHASAGEIQEGDRVVGTVGLGLSGPGVVVDVERFAADDCEPGSIRYVHVRLDSGPLVYVPLSAVTREAPAGEQRDGSDWPSREQVAVMETVARRFGSVAVDRVHGTDDMRMSTPDGDVIVNVDGERRPCEGPDYAAITRLRLNLATEANRLRYGGLSTYEIGMGIQALEHAENALFDTLNILSSYLHDEDAEAAIQAWHEAKRNA